MLGLGAAAKMRFVEQIGEARKRRAAARSEWPGALRPLAEAEEAFAPAGTTAGERIAMVWQLTLEAWACTGRPLPDYPREAAPGRVRRLGDSAE